MTFAALLSDAAPAAADDATSHPLAVLAPVTGAFAEEAEPTDVDELLNAVMPQQAAGVIGSAIDQVDSVFGYDSAGADESQTRELNLECRPDTGSCREVPSDPQRPSATRPRG